MSVIASANKSFQITPKGVHVARCIRVIDLGTQRDEYQGKSKSLHKVRLSWELPEEKSIFDDKRGEEPFVISKTYTLALGEKATLRHDLESWRGKNFSESELDAFDLSTLLGGACQLNVIHKVSKKGRKYASIINVTPLPKGVTAPAQILPTILYLIEDGFGDAFENLPEFTQEEIKKSEEYQRAESTSGGENDAVNAELGASTNGAPVEEAEEVEILW